MFAAMFNTPENVSLYGFTEVNPWALIDALEVEAAHRDVAEFFAEERTGDDGQPREKKGKKLGAYVNGKLRFQTHDTAALYTFAEEEMRTFGNNVWVCPVGSFVTAEEAEGRRAAQMRKVHSA